MLLFCYVCAVYALYSAERTVIHTRRKALSLDFYVAKVYVVVDEALLFVFLSSVAIVAHANYHFFYFIFLLQSNCR